MTQVSGALEKIVGQGRSIYNVHPSYICYTPEIYPAKIKLRGELFQKDNLYLTMIDHDEIENDHFVQVGLMYLRVLGLIKEEIPPEIIYEEDLLDLLLDRVEKNYDKFLRNIIKGIFCQNIMKRNDLKKIRRLLLEQYPEYLAEGEYRKKKAVNQDPGISSDVVKQYDRPGASPDDPSQNIKDTSSYGTNPTYDTSASYNGMSESEALNAALQESLETSAKEA
eukprot:CAMPEP_0114601306 /NCGR_PEP_ID=MMETSP0125-20121206/23934_1 /TAXON_ID=485358 ORGANISM="Aristerostoma sp., Strain ATCC 50986" /NCGR_SAMPLE_ID=MMETSP0125 /ASSEMBLY_ACC=CAM_ASM_000245 /LENGTH=222 /DNA_ID=CAMNT_0001810421 /DNA_START=135 /DNA_END=803 /DNA_ORIENTATION=-